MAERGLKSRLVWFQSPCPFCWAELLFRHAIHPVYQGTDAGYGKRHILDHGTNSGAEPRSSLHSSQVYHLVGREKQWIRTRNLKVCFPRIKCFLTICHVLSTVWGGMEESECETWCLSSSWRNRPIWNTWNNKHL